MNRPRYPARPRVKSHPWNKNIKQAQLPCKSASAILKNKINLSQGLSAYVKIIRKRQSWYFPIFLFFLSLGATHLSSIIQATSYSNMVCF